MLIRRHYTTEEKLMKEKEKNPFHRVWMFYINTVDNNKLLIAFTRCLLKVYLECILVLSWEE